MSGQIVSCPTCRRPFQMPVVYQQPMLAASVPVVTPGPRVPMKQKGSGAFFATFVVLMLVAGALSGVTYWVLSHKTPSNIETSDVNGTEPRIANNDSSAVNPITSSSQEPGKLRLTVTWQYNKYVGTKPDTDAIVIMVPLGFSGSFDAPVPPSYGRAAFDRERSRLKAMGVHLGLVGGDGKALVSAISPGEYHLIIISKNTIEELKLGELRAERFKEICHGDVGSSQRMLISTVTINSGEESEYSHDFGNTYYRSE